MKSVVIRVFGRVQGVYYRASTLNEATSLELTGWVRNRLNGSVEILAYGPEKKIESLIAWSRKGPPASRVDRIELENIELKTPPLSFSIVDTK